MTSAAFARAVLQVDWSQYETAYGSATNLPLLLIKLAGSDQPEAQKASHDLWCSLCHQHAYVSSAALPALPFILEALDGAQEELTVEILDILLGFAVCTTEPIEGAPWVKQLRQDLLEKLPWFTKLAESANEDVASFAQSILENLKSDPKDANA